MDEQAGSPTNSPSVEEVQGVFPNETSLQDAIAQLTLAGFDRAAFSLPETSPPAGHATPEGSADTPATNTDIRQARTMGTSMAGTIGAFAAAGAVVATGGAAAVAGAAAAAIGIGSGLTAHAVGDAAEKTKSDERATAAAEGRLVLAVYAPTAAKQATAQRLMQAAGASKVAGVRRTDGTPPAVDSSGWTG